MFLYYVRSPHYHYCEDLYHQTDTMTVLEDETYSTPVFDLLCSGKKKSLPTTRLVLETDGVLFS